MGVMACARKDCNSIMCTHYSHDYGYICDDCLEELNHFCTIHGLSAESIYIFMRTSKRKAIKPTDTVYDVFKGV